MEQLHHMYDKLAFALIIQVRMIEQSQQNSTKDTHNCLEVIQANQEIKESPAQQMHSFIIYRQEGNSLTTYQRIHNQAEECPNGSPLVLTAQNEGQNILHQRKHAHRYFQPSPAENQIRFAKCFRCGRKGHTVKHCPIAQENKCMYCLGDHHHSNCNNSKSCFLCNQVGHIARECKAARLKCRKCGNKGHLQEECGVIVFLNSSGIRVDRKFRERYGFDDLMQIRCLAACKYPKGHFNCHQYKDTRDKLYPEAAIQKTIIREKYILSNFNKLREIYFKQQVAKSTQTLKKVQNQEIIKEKMANQDEQEEGMEIATEP